MQGVRQTGAIHLPSEHTRVDDARDALREAVVFAVSVHRPRRSQPRVRPGEARLMRASDEPTLQFTRVVGA